MKSVNHVWMIEWGPKHKTPCWMSGPFYPKKKAKEEVQHMKDLHSFQSDISKNEINLSKDIAIHITKFSRCPETPKAR